VATLEAVRSGAPVSPPSAWNEEVPPALDRAILGALERDPSRRTGSAQELGAALAAVLLGITRAPADVDLRDLMHRLFADEIAAQQTPPEPTRVRPPPAASEPVAPFAAAAPAPEDAPTRTAPAAAPRRARRLAGVAGAAVLLGAAGLAALPLVRRAAAPLPASTAPAIPANPPAPPPAAPAAPAPAAIAPRPTPPVAPAQLAGGHPVPDALPAPPAAEPEGEANAGVAPLEVASGLSALAVPAPASGQGILSVNATPWGLVRVNGHEVGDTPKSMRLPAGRHRVHIERKGQRAVDELVTVKAGMRTKILR
jgi:serine/threonine-protein kinase